jgi:hypothetical protein
MTKFLNLILLKTFNPKAISLFGLGAIAGAASGRLGMGNAKGKNLNLA